MLNVLVIAGLVPCIMAKPIQPRAQNTHLPDLPTLQASILPSLPTGSLLKLPTSGLPKLPVPVSSAAPKLPIKERQPGGGIAGGVGGALSGALSGVVPTLPTSNLPSLPTGSLTKLPTSGLPKVPMPAPSAAPKLPIEERQLGGAIGSVLSKLPTPSLPMSGLPTLPTSGLPSLPTSGLPSLPTSGLPSLPTSGLPKPSVPSTLPKLPIKKRQADYAPDTPLMNTPIPDVTLLPEPVGKDCGCTKQCETGEEDTGKIYKCMAACVQKCSDSKKSGAGAAAPDQINPAGGILGGLGGGNGGPLNGLGL